VRRFFAGVEHACMHRICFRKTESAVPVRSIRRPAGLESACIHYCNDVYLGQIVQEQEREREREGTHDAWISNKRVFALSRFRYAIRVCLSDRVASTSWRFTLTRRSPSVREVLIKREMNRVRFHLPLGLPRFNRDRHAMSFYSLFHSALRYRWNF